MSYTAKPEPQSHITSLSTWSKGKLSKELTKRIRTHYCYRLKEIHSTFTGARVSGALIETAKSLAGG